MESYTYSIKNQISDKDKLATKISEEDKKKIEEIVEEKIKWLDSNPDASVEEMKKQKKELEEIVQPIVSKLYQEGAGGAGAGAGGEAPPPTGEEESKDDSTKDEL